MTDSEVRTKAMNALLESAPRTIAVIPAYRASASLSTVVAECLAVVDHVVVVDDACPEHCSSTLDPEPRVTIIKMTENGGVGAATKAGIVQALLLGAETIVKVDADGQMDTRYIPHMVEFLRTQPEIDLVKGNRFADAATLQRMPLVRLIGNAGLTLLVKFSSGYWTIVDPTNGYIAMRRSAVQRIDIKKLADRYFFEIDLLCEFGLMRSPIAEFEMPAIYGSETSSLSIRKALFTFPGKLLVRFLRRILLNYLVVEINVGSICGITGIPLLIAAIIFGSHEWLLSYSLGQPRPTGTIIFALLLFILGFQLSMQALLYDVQFSTRTVKVRRNPAAAAASATQGREIFFAS